jgi:MOB kinase activator 1
MNLFKSNATLKPLKAHKAGKRSELSEYSKKTLATLGTGSMKEAVQLPPGENLNEWLAVNTVDFFNELSMLYGTVSSAADDTPRHPPHPSIGGQ